MRSAVYSYFCPETKVPKILRSKGEMARGEAPLQTRHFDGFRYAVKMTNTAVGLSRPVGGFSLQSGVVRSFTEFDRLDLWRSNGVALGYLR